MVENTLALLGQSSEGRAPSPENKGLGLGPRALVLPFGCRRLSTVPITQILREKNVSYLVITPTVDHLTEADHALYVKRLNGDLLTVQDVLSASITLPWWEHVPGKRVRRLARLLSFNHHHDVSLLWVSSRASSPPRRFFMRRTDLAPIWHRLPSDSKGLERGDNSGRCLSRRHSGQDPYGSADASAISRPCIRPIMPLHSRPPIWGLRSGLARP